MAQALSVATPVTSVEIKSGSAAGKVLSLPVKPEPQGELPQEQEAAVLALLLF